VAYKGGMHSNACVPKDTMKRWIVFCLFTISSLNAIERTSKAYYTCPETKGIDAPIIVIGTISRSYDNNNDTATKSSLEIIDTLKGEIFESSITVQFDHEYIEKCQMPVDGDSVIVYMDSSMNVLRVALPTMESISKYRIVYSISTNLRARQIYRSRGKGKEIG